MMKAPFPYFGGKARAAALVWERFGDPFNFVEPFAGSCAVLLARPHAPRLETVNDKDALLANFWRALQHDPEGVAYWADSPVNEADLHARHRALVDRRVSVEELMSDPDAYDVRLAGWWVWGISCWIGSGWCEEAKIRQRPDLGGSGASGHGIHRQIPHLGGKKQDYGRGINRQLPNLGGENMGGQGIHRQQVHLSDDGCGVHRSTLAQQLPHLGGDGLPVHRPGSSNILAYLQQLADRLRRVRVCCGDWTRVLGPSVTYLHGLTAILLDPPYDAKNRTTSLYAQEMPVSHAVGVWARENGDNPLLRIALCGYEGEYDMPDHWVKVAWKASGGYGNQGTGRGRENANQERIWFSPHCLNAIEDLPLFQSLREGVPE